MSTFLGKLAGWFFKGSVASAPADGDIWAYDSTEGVFEIRTPSTGAPTTADYLVGSAQAGLSAEIVVGTTPGGELGGTWAAPTVDVTHSGSAHHTQSHPVDSGTDHAAGTLGDLIYAAVAGAWTRLTGNTTTTRKFLRQIGDGAASAAPAWDTLVTGDIPTTLTAKTLDGTTTIDGRVLFDKGIDIASGATITPGTDGNYFHITGTTGITAIASLQAGTVVVFEFDGALTITHNATSLILQGSASLRTAAGDVVAFISEGAGNWRELFRRLAAPLTPEWTNLYQGGAEADDSHALATPSDGSVVRMRIDTSTIRLYRQRVADPWVASPAWSSWTLWRTATRLICCAFNGATINAFCVDNTNPALIYQSTSTNSGVSWGAFSLLQTAPGTVTYLAASMKSNGDILLIYSVAATLYHKKYTVAGGWGAETASGLTFNSITGLAVSYRKDFNVIITGTEVTTLAPMVWQAIYGDGYSQTLDTWSAISGLVREATGDNTSFLSPNIASFGSGETMTYIEKYSTDLHRIWVQQLFGDFTTKRWMQPVRFMPNRVWGLAQAYQAPYRWSSNPSHVAFSNS